MRRNPRGLVLIITNIDYKYSDKEPRNSAKHDESNLKQLFDQMGFHVISYRNLTGEVNIIVLIIRKQLKNFKL